MTKKGKFFQAIEQLGAKRVTEFGWANIPDENVWVAYHYKDVHIFSQPGGDEGYFDHYIIDVERCHWDNMVLCAIINLTNLDYDDCCAEKEERILLRQFANDETEMDVEDVMHAVWYLWEYCDCITQQITKTGWSQHGTYEDDKEEGAALLALSDVQRKLVLEIEENFTVAEQLGIGYYLDENNNIVFYNANNVERGDDDEECAIYDSSKAYHSNISPEWWTERDGFKIKNR